MILRGSHSWLLRGRGGRLAGCLRAVCRSCLPRPRPRCPLIGPQPVAEPLSVASVPEWDDVRSQRTCVECFTAPDQRQCADGASVGVACGLQSRGARRRSEAPVGSSPVWSERPSRAMRRSSTRRRYVARLGACRSVFTWRLPPSSATCRCSVRQPGRPGSIYGTWRGRAVPRPS